jgi:hypothetical protein
MFLYHRESFRTSKITHSVRSCEITYTSMKPLKPSKKQTRVVAPAWAELLDAHIDSKPRGYQAKMSRETGCSESIINRIKKAGIGVSEWTEVLAIYTGLPIPPLVVDEDQAQILILSENLSAAKKKLVISMIRGLIDM